MKKIITGIIGYGVVGKRRHFFLQKNNQYNVKYISDILFENNFKKKNILYFRQYLELLNQKDLDAIFITLPNYLAPIVTISALKKIFMFFVRNLLLKMLRILKKLLKLKKNLKT